MAKVQINQEDLLQHAQELNSNMEYFESIGRPLLEEYSKDLDEKVGAVKAYLDQCRQYDLDFDILSIPFFLFSSTKFLFSNL